MTLDSRPAASRLRFPLVCFLSTSGSTNAQDRVPTGWFDLQLNFEQSRGLYREPCATIIRSSSVLGRYRGETWVAEIQVPYLGTRTSGHAGGLPGTAVAGRSIESGLGDVWLKLGIEVREFTALTTGVDLTVKVQTRTGDVQRGLGTGGTDLALQADLIRSLGPLVAFGHLGYRGQVYVTLGFAPASPQWALCLSLRARFVSLDLPASGTPARDDRQPFPGTQSRSSEAL